MNLIQKIKAKFGSKKSFKKNELKTMGKGKEVKKTKKAKKAKKNGK